MAKNRREFDVKRGASMYGVSFGLYYPNEAKTIQPVVARAKQKRESLIKSAIESARLRQCLMESQSTPKKSSVHQPNNQ